MKVYKKIEIEQFIWSEVSRFLSTLSGDRLKWAVKNLDKFYKSELDKFDFDTKQKIELIKFFNL